MSIHAGGFMHRHLIGEPAQAAGVAMPANQFFRLRGSRGARIVCLSGKVLITASEHYQDIDLDAVDSFVVPNDGLVLVEAIGEATINIERQDRGSSAWQALLRAARRAYAHCKWPGRRRQPGAARTLA